LWFLLVIVLLFGVLAPGGSEPSVYGATGGTTRYVEVTPFRLADTRINLGAQRIDSNTWRVTVAGVNGVPANAAAVAVSLVATGAREPGNLLTYPAGEARPTASNLNYDAGQTYSTGAIVPLGAGGAFDVYTLNPVDFVVDVTGAFVPATAASAGRFVPIPPTRRLDTRNSGWLDPGETANVRLGSSVPTDATAAIVTLTSTAPNSPGYFTAWASGAIPQTSTLNVSNSGTTRATTAIVPIANRTLKVASSNGGHLIVDLIGYFTGPSAASNANGLFIPMSPTRQLDTRQQGAFLAGETRAFVTTGGGAAVGSLAMVNPAQPGYGALFANGTPNPGTSAINLDATTVIANMAVTRTSAAGVAIYSSADTHYIFDQFGTFTSDQAAVTVPVAPTTPAVRPAPSPSTGGCSVNAILVPSCGAWFGATTPAYGSHSGFETGLPQYEAVAQNTPDIQHFYKTGAQKFPTADEVALSERPGKQRSLLLYAWKPSANATWRQIAQGAADSEIATVAASIKAYPRKMFLAIYHEPEDNVNPSSGSGMTAADYGDMYRYVVTKLRQAGVNNVVFVWNTMGYYGWEEYLDELYPGHDYVDWLCYDPYMKDDKQANLAVMINNPHANIDWPGYYSWATAKAPGKPLMLCEWGVDLNSNADPAGKLAGDAAQLLAAYPMMKALVFWNAEGEGNYRIDETSAKGTALGAAFRRLANQPYFNATSPNSAP
jgi:hypothetical protein